MKIFLLLHIIATLFLCGCNALYTADEVKEFIPGTYIRFSQHEYGTEYDTLVISLQNKSAGEYSILRKWKYERILDGKPVEPEYKRTTTSGIYDINQKLLTETQSGDLFSFDSEQNLLFVGSSKYRKI
ncbi:MAG: hypothetical protein ABI675_14405 [Chitinophagaceae bacterium]